MIQIDRCCKLRAGSKVSHRADTWVVVRNQVSMWLQHQKGMMSPIDSDQRNDQWLERILEPYLVTSTPENVFAHRWFIPGGAG